MAYALYKDLFNIELFPLEEYLDEQFRVGSTFTNCGIVHVVLCKYERKKLKVSCTFVDFKDSPYAWDVNVDFYSDYFNAAYILSHTYFYRKVKDKISEEEVSRIKTYVNTRISVMNSAVEKLELIE